MDPRADIDMVANFEIVNSRLESTWDSEVVQPGKIVIDSANRLPNQRCNAAWTIYNNAYIFQSNCPRRSFYFCCFFLLLSYILPLALYVPVSSIFNFSPLFLRHLLCLLHFLNLTLFVYEAIIDAIRAIEVIPLIATVYSVNDKVIRIWNGSSGSLKMHC